MISTVLWLLFDFLPLKNDVKVPAKSNMQKNFFFNKFDRHPKGTKSDLDQILQIFFDSKQMCKILFKSESVPSNFAKKWLCSNGLAHYRTRDPDPKEMITDPQHWNPDWKIFWLNTLISDLLIEESKN